MQNITEVMKKYPIDPDNSDSVLQFIVQFFSIMDNDRDLCLALLGPHGDMAFVEQIENLLAETFLKRLPEKLPKMIRISNIHMHLFSMAAWDLSAPGFHVR